MTVNPDYPIITRALNHLYPSEEIASILANKLSKMIEMNKTDGAVKIQRLNDGTDDYYGYRFWADVESAEYWIEECKSMPAEYMASMSIVDSSEIADL
jgi:hypothetical protein